MAYSGKTITFATDLLPQEDNIYSLGNNDQRWKIYGEMQPIAIKTYTAALYNSSSGANYYQTFATVAPVDYNAIWIAHYRITITASGHSDYTEICDVSISGRSNTYYSYKIYNSLVTYPIYLHALLNGSSASYPHELGYRMAASYGATNVQKTVKVELLEQINCTITLLDNLKLYTSAVPTNYTAWRTFNATSNGLQETGDANDTAAYINSNGFKGQVGSNKIYPYTLFAKTGNGKYESFVLSSTTAATKSVNTHGFLPDGKIYYNSGSVTYNEGTLSFSAYQQYHVVDYRYSFNINNSTLPDYCETYLVWTYNTADGLLYLDTTQWLATALPSSEDGKIYQRIGSKYYTGTSNYYQASLLLNNQYYEYKNEALHEWNGRSADAAAVNGLTVQTAVPENAIFTDHYDWSDITSKPTTLSGYGITDAAASGHDHDSTYLKLSGGTMVNSNFSSTSNKSFLVRSATSGGTGLSIGSGGLQAYSYSGTTASYGTLYLQYNGGSFQLGKSGTNVTSALYATATLNGTYNFSTSAGFKFSGIAAETVNKDRPIWFAYCANASSEVTLGTPGYDASFTYNPSTDLLKVKNIEASNSIKVTGTVTSSSNGAKATYNESYDAPKIIFQNTVSGSSTAQSAYLISDHLDSASNSVFGYTLGLVTDQIKGVSFRTNGIEATSKLAVGTDFDSNYAVKVSGDSSFSGLVTVNTNITSGTCVTIKNTGSVGSSCNGLDIMSSDMQANSKIYLTIGKENVDKNRGYIGFHYDTSGSTNNYLMLGLKGVGALLALTCNGYVGIGTTSPNAKLEVNGDGMFDGKISFAISSTEKAYMTYNSTDNSIDFMFA